MTVEPAKPPANKRRSAVLLIGFCVFCTGASSVWADGDLWPARIVLGALAGLAISLYGYFFAGPLVLKINHAIPAVRDKHARLINVVEGLAHAAGMPVPAVYVVAEASPNAFAVGRDHQHAAIAATTGLTESLNRVELEGVLAHEISHIQTNDMAIGTLVVVVPGMVMVIAELLLRTFFRGGPAGRIVGAVPAAAGLVLLLLAPLIAWVFKLALPAQREVDADAGAIALTRYPPGLIDALKKLANATPMAGTPGRSTAHLWITSPLERRARGLSGRLNRLFDTHPPLQERIEQLRSL